MVKEERIENRQKIITEQEASGMTPRAFCHRRPRELTRVMLMKRYTTELLRSVLLPADILVTSR